MSLHDFAQTLKSQFQDVFSPHGKLHLARAPGRLDVMGGIADYSGSLVLEWPLQEGTHAAVQKRADRSLNLVSVGDSGRAGSRSRILRIDEIQEAIASQGYEGARCFFAALDEQDRWTAYAAGVLVVLHIEKGLPLKGANILIHSEVPEGKGVSSSAALEVAVMRAAAACFGVELEGLELATWSQIVENRVVGAPCGLMDQLTVAFGREGHLLPILCRPATLFPPRELPSHLRLFGIDSSVRHVVSGSDYTSVRIGAFMGLRHLRLALEKEGRPPIEHLTEIDAEQFRSRYGSTVPVRLRGSEFLEIYGELPDSVTQVDPDRTYEVFEGTRHPIEEHDRVTRFQEGLTSTNESDVARLGELMYASHQSYSRCALGSEATDRLVELAQQAGRERGIYGAKISGGGSGGTVVFLGGTDSEATVDEIAQRFGEEKGISPRVFKGSSPSASDTPVLAVPG